MRHRLAIATIFRNESRYLREWVGYHRLVGFEHFYMLCHDDDPDEELRAYAALASFPEGLVDVRDHRDGSGEWQMAGWARLLTVFGGECEWLLLTDADAFCYPVYEDSVLPALAAAPADAAGLAVYTCTYGSSGRLLPPPLQTTGFLRRAKLSDPSNHTANYLLRPDRLEPPTPERGYGVPKPGFRLYDTSGTDVTGLKKRPGPLDRLRLNHYSVRSAYDWEAKVKRGWPEDSWHDPNHTIADHKFKLLDRNEEFDDGPAKRFGPALEKALGVAT